MRGRGFGLIYQQGRNLIPAFTDSLYMSLSGPTIESVVRPELRAEFERVKGSWMVRDDTVEHTRHDSRVPGESLGRMRFLK